MASVNQSAPSGPVVIPCGLLSFVGGANSVKVWLAPVVIRPILLGLLACSVSDSENHTAPSGPAVIMDG